MANPRGWKCWRCHKVPVRVSGVPCEPCRQFLIAEYWEKRRANGGKFLYIPDHLDELEDIPFMTEILKRPTRMCSECTKEFEPRATGGRPQTRCNECRGTAVVRSPSRAVAVPPPIAKPRVAVAQTGVPLNMPELTERVLREIDELESGIAARIRLMRSLEAYQAAKNGTHG